MFRKQRDVEPGLLLRAHHPNEPDLVRASLWVDDMYFNTKAGRVVRYGHKNLAVMAEFNPPTELENKVRFAEEIRVRCGRARPVGWGMRIKGDEESPQGHPKGFGFSIRMKHCAVPAGRGRSVVRG